MNIEKVSKYISVNNGKSPVDGQNCRRVLISIPRVRWLERGGNYVSNYVLEEDIVAVDAQTTHRLFGKPLSVREQRVLNLRDRGMSYTEIAMELKLSKDIIKNLILSGLRKTGRRPCKNT